MEFLELARERYSVRKFADRPIETEKLDRILEAARLAPTGKNLQPLRIYQIQSPEGLEKVNGLSPCIWGAPTVFALCYDDGECWHDRDRPGRKSGEIDCTIVGDHMVMEAWEQGIGSCWVLLFDPDGFAEQFDLPETVRPVVLIPMGYAHEDAAPSERHTSYRPLEEIVVEA